MKLWELRRAAAAFFLPNRCPFCDEIIGIRDFWCGRCYNRLRFVDRLEEMPQGLDGFSAVCWYAGNARTAVLRLKKGFNRSPIDAFAVLITENAHPLIAAADFITAVPTGKRRRRELGYAQSEKIAKLVSQMSGKPFRRVLSVTAAKKEQKRLNAVQRWENALKSYVLSAPDKVRGRNVLIVDDVCTTGSTLGAIAEMMKAAGAESVTGAVFAKTVKK